MSEEWTRAECSAHVGVTPGTWGAYVSRNQAPQPTRHVGATPVWDADEVRDWNTNRPGRGKARREPDSGR